MTADGGRAEPGAASPGPLWVRLLALLAICAPVVAPLGSPGLVNPDEGRFAEIAREMLATGDWLVPRLNGIPHWSKPPLTYWATGVSLQAFGLTERAARLPSALAASAALLATWFLARRMGGTKVATIAVVALATMFLFHVVGRTITTDMIQAACTTWAAALVWAARDGTRPALRWAAFLCLGVSFVAKGPVALGIFLAALLVFRLLRPAVTLVSVRQAALGIGIVLMIGLPWFLAVIRLHPDLAGFFLGRELKDRYLTGVHGRSQGPWFLPVVLLGGTLPWTATFVAAAARAWKERRRAAAGEDGDAGRFLFAWIAGPFLLFAFSGSKLATYLLPLMPFCAIAVARWIVAAGDRPKTRAARAVLAIMVLTPALLAAGVAVAAIAMFAAPVLPWTAAAVVVAIASAAMFLKLRSSRAPLGPVAAAALAGLLTLLWEWSVPLLADEHAMDLRTHASQSWIREVVARDALRGAPISAALRPAADGGAAATPANILIYRLKVNSLPFYLFGTRPEYVPAFGTPAGWEIASDQEQARVPMLPDLVAQLRRDDRVHVLTRRASIREIEEALGQALVVVAAHGRGEHAVVLVANR